MSRRPVIARFQGELLSSPHGKKEPQVCQWLIPLSSAFAANHWIRQFCQGNLYIRPADSFRTYGLTLPPCSSRFLPVLLHVLWWDVWFGARSGCRDFLSLIYNDAGGASGMASDLGGSLLHALMLSKKKLQHRALETFHLSDRRSFDRSINIKKSNEIYQLLLIPHSNQIRPAPIK